MSQSLKLKLRQCALSMAYFLAISMLLYLNDVLFRTAPDLQQTGDYRVFENGISYLLGGLLGGALFSVFEFFLLENLFSRYGLFMLTIGRMLVIMASYVFLSVLLSFQYNVNATGAGVFSSEVLAGVHQYITGPIFIINMAFYMVFILILVYMHQISTIVGRGVLGKFLFARYRQPEIVERVFLFMDINSSTRIAEDIGHERFFGLIQEFHVEAGKEILEHGGEIYKYVGDEVIAYWPITSGAGEARALACLFAIQDRIAQKAPEFERRYGHAPTFKSGLHLGSAMTGELGDWKREIAFMGDVLNTTARIQEACKKIGTWLLVSDAYKALIEVPERWEFTEAGRGRLRGKEEAITLFKVQRA